MLRIYVVFALCVSYDRRYKPNKLKIPKSYISDTKCIVIVMCTYKDPARLI